MLAASPVTFEVKSPKPDPSEVLVLSAMVGFGVVLQHTPLSVTGAPPSAITVLLAEAALRVMADTADVEQIGAVVVLAGTLPKLG